MREDLSRLWPRSQGLLDKIFPGEGIIFHSGRVKGRTLLPFPHRGFKSSRVTRFHVKIPLSSAKQTEPGLIQERRALASWRQAWASATASNILPDKDCTVCFGFELPCERGGMKRAAAPVTSTSPSQRLPQLTSALCPVLASRWRRSRSEVITCGRSMGSSF